MINNYICNREEMKHLEQILRKDGILGIVEKYEAVEEGWDIGERYEHYENLWKIGKDLYKGGIEPKPEEKEKNVKKIREEVDKDSKILDETIKDVKNFDCETKWDYKRYFNRDETPPIFITKIIRGWIWDFRFRYEGIGLPTVSEYLNVPQILELIRLEKQHLKKTDYDFSTTLKRLEKLEASVIEIAKICRFDYSKLADIVHVDEQVEAILKSI